MKKIFFRLLSVCVIAGITLAGVLFTRAYYIGVEEAMRSELLKAAVNLSLMINMVRIEALKGDSADYNSDVYARLKKQFVASRGLYPGLRFLYLMGKKPSGEVFFYVDSEPEGSPDESPPGQIYDEADLEVKGIFTSGEAAVTGPTEDRWGVFMTALAPLYSYSSGKVTAVLGMDVEADEWRKKAAIKALPAALFFVFVSLFFCLVFIMIEMKVNGRRAVLAAAGVLCAACVVFLAAYNDEREKRLNAGIFSELFSAGFRAKIFELKQLRDIKFEAVKSFFEQNDYVDGRKFKGFVSSVNPGPAAIAWFWAEKKGQAGYRIKYEEGFNQRRAKQMLGGVLLRPETAEAIEEAEKTGLPLISAPFGSTACMVWKIEGRNQRGILGAIVDFEPIASVREMALEKKYPGCLHLFDASDGKMVLLNGLLKVRPDRVPDEKLNIFDAKAGEFHSALFFLGRVYRVYIHNEGRMPYSGALWKTLVAGTGGGILILMAMNTALIRRESLLSTVRQSVRQLRENEMQALSTLQSIADGVISFDNKGRISVINKAVAEITGLRAEDVIGLELEKIKEFVFESGERDFYGRMFDTHSGCRFANATVKTPHSGVRVIEGSCSPVKNDDGKLSGFIMAFRDTTERVESEKDEELHRQRLQSLVRIMSENKETVQGFLDFSLNEAVKITSSKIGYIYFYDEEKKEFELNSWSREVMKECEVTEKQTKYYLEKTGIWGDAVRQRKTIIVNDFAAPDPGKKGYPKGHVRLERFMTIPVFEGSKIVAVVGVANKKAPYDETDVLQLKLLMKSVWEITCRKKAEQGLKASLEKIAGIFSAAPVGMVVVVDRIVTEVNPYMEEMTGYAREELIGKKSLMLYPDEEHFKRVGEIEYQMMKETGRGSVETKWKRKNGTLTDIFLSSAWVDPADTSKGAIFTALDITDRKTSENKLKQIVEELKKIDAMKSNFISMVSHELRTPLTSIKGFVSLLLRGAAGELNEKQTDYLETASVNSERLLKLINDILDISKLESGNFEVKMEKYEAADLLREVIKETSVIAEKKSILLVENSVEGAEIYSDRFRTAQVLINLVTNSMKFSPENSTVYVMMAQPEYSEIKSRAEKAGVNLAPGRYSVFSVKDEGRGIEDIYLKKLFERFFQIQEGDSKVYKGVGLGLHICKQIVEKHGGHIWAESEGAGKGSEFVFVIPGR